MSGCLKDDSFTGVWEQEKLLVVRLIYLRSALRIADQSMAAPKRASKIGLKFVGLPYVHVSRAGGNFHLGAATAHRPFQFVTAQRALHGNWEIGVD